LLQPIVSDLPRSSFFAEFYKFQCATLKLARVPIFNKMLHGTGMVGFCFTGTCFSCILGCNALLDLHFYFDFKWGLWTHLWCLCWLFLKD